MAAHQVLFCPFCRECFEDSSTCPEHELRLVAFDQLAPDPQLADEDQEEEHAATRGASVAAEDAAMAALDPRFGRGWVALGAALNGLSLVLGLVRVAPARVLATYELAPRLPSLWTLGLVSVTALYALARRRTPAQLRSLRVLFPLLALISPATLLWALARLGWQRELGAAPYAVAAASALMLFGGLKLGVPRPPAHARSKARTA